MRVGIFDSGIGGFTVLSEILKLLPDLTIDYISDDAFAPYGNKSDEFVKERCTVLTEELLERGAELIILACNTATAVAIKDLRNRYDIPFVGIEPYLNFLNHLEDKTGREKMVVLTTEVTGSSEKFLQLKKKLDPDNNIQHYVCPNLASIIEKNFNRNSIEEMKREVEEELAPLKERGFTHAILGCTHYPLIASLISEVLNLTCISPGPSVAKRVIDLLKNGNCLQNPGTHSCKDFFFKTTSGTDWEKITLPSF